MTEQIIVSIVSYVVPTVYMLMLGWVVKAIKGSRKRQDAIEGGIKCLLRERLIQMHRDHVINGNAVTLEEYNSRDDMQACYSILKGKNGYMDKISEEYKNAPLSGKE